MKKLLFILTFIFWASWASWSLAAGPYYVDIGNPGAWNGRDGTSSESPWLGVSGLQKAFDSITAGNGPTYIKGTGDLSVFYLVTYDASSGTTMTDGEACTWTDSTGVIHCGDTSGGSGTVEIEKLTGNAPSEDTVITGSTSGETITPTATISQKGIDVDTNSGDKTTNGFIKFIGVNDSWSEDGTRTSLDGNDIADDIIGADGTADHIWIANFEVKDTSGDDNNGFDGTNGGGTLGWLFTNCSATDVYYGWYGDFEHGIFYRDVAYSCRSIGFHQLTQTSYGRYFYCCAHDNTSHGWSSSIGNEVYVGCVSVLNGGNAFNNIRSAYAPVFVNCVMSANAGQGIAMEARADHGTAIFLANRITDHDEVDMEGINVNTEPMILGFNYFEDNTDNVNDESSALVDQFYGATNYNITTGTGTDVYTDTNFGYINAASNFSTGYTDTDDPTGRRIAITIPWN